MVLIEKWQFIFSLLGSVAGTCSIYVQMNLEILQNYTYRDILQKFNLYTVCFSNTISAKEGKETIPLRKKKVAPFFLIVPKLFIVRNEVSISHGLISRKKKKSPFIQAYL